MVPITAEPRLIYFYYLPQSHKKYLCFVVFLLLILNFHFHAAVSAIPMSMQILSICKHIVNNYKINTKKKFLAKHKEKHTF